MKTTLNIEDGLLRAAKRLAAERGTTLTHVIEEALRGALRVPKDSKPYRLRWRPVRGRRLPEVDVSDRTALHDRMEGRLGDWTARRRRR